MNNATRTMTLAAALWPARGAGSDIFRGLVLAVSGTVFLTISAKFQIPFWPVPFTLQTLVVATLGMVYGRKLAAATLLLYFGEGAVGLPVFATGGGLLYFAGPTAGYLACLFARRVFAGLACRARLGAQFFDDNCGDDDCDGGYFRRRRFLAWLFGRIRKSDSGRLVAVYSERDCQDCFGGAFVADLLAQIRTRRAFGRFLIRDGFIRRHFGFASRRSASAHNAVAFAARLGNRPSPARIRLCDCADCGRFVDNRR